MREGDASLSVHPQLACLTQYDAALTASLMSLVMMSHWLACLWGPCNDLRSKAKK